MCMSQAMPRPEMFLQTLSSTLSSYSFGRYVCNICISRAVVKQGAIHFSVRELLWRERSRMMNASVRCLGRVQRCSIMQCNIRGSLQVTDLKSRIYDALIQYLCGTHE